MRLVMKRCGAVATAVGALAFGVPAAAEAQTTQTFTTSHSEFDPGVRNQGWWTASDFPNRDANDDYLVGIAGLVRNFFTFDLSSACRAGSVTLQLTRFIQSGALSYSLFDVSTPAAQLNANEGASQTIFDDLGSGTSFGSFPVAEGAPEDVLSFPLNAAGVAAFNAARGEFFSVGGSAPTTAGSLFVPPNLSGPGTQQLVVTCLQRMVGKGSLTGGGTTVSYAYIVGCPATGDPPFEIRSGTFRFRLRPGAVVTCSDDPNVPTPAASFDTQVGKGVFRLGAGGDFAIAWKFVDAGLGGIDSARITIRTSSGFVVFDATASPPGKFPGSTQPTGFNTAQLLP